MKHYSIQDLLIALEQGAHVHANTWWAKFTYRMIDGKIQYKANQGEWTEMTTSYDLNRIVEEHDFEVDYEPLSKKQVREFLE